MDGELRNYKMGANDNNLKIINTIFEGDAGKENKILREVISILIQLIDENELTESEVIQLNTFKEYDNLIKGQNE